MWCVELGNYILWDYNWVVALDCYVEQSKLEAFGEDYERTFVVSVWNLDREWSKEPYYYDVVSHGGEED